MVALAAWVLPTAYRGADAQEVPLSVRSSVRTVTLVTGEKVHIVQEDRDHTTLTVEPSAPATGPAAARRFQTLDAHGHRYVVPDEAMPYIGRQLDLSLFDVAQPPAGLSINWSPGATPHEVPGLRMQATGEMFSARVTVASAFGAALRAGRPGAGALAGVRSITADRAAPSAARSAGPLYPMTTVTVRGLDALGTATSSGTASLVNADDAARNVSFGSFLDGELSFSVPEGHYSLSASISTYLPATGEFRDSLIILPDVAVVQSGTVVVADARAATTLVPVPATPRPSVVEQTQVAYARVSASGVQVSSAMLMLNANPRLYVAPTPKPQIGELHWYTYFHLHAPADQSEQYVYDLEFPADGGVPDRFADRVTDGSLTTLDVAYHADMPGPIATYRGSYLPWETFSLRGSSEATAPAQRTEYLTGRPDLAWVGGVVWKPDEYNGLVQSPRTVYQAGQRHSERFLAAPLAPGVAGAPADTGGAAAGTVTILPCGACRQGDQLQLALEPWTDNGQHFIQMLTPSATLQVTSATRLYADGALLASGTAPGGTLAVPHAAADLRLELDTTKSAGWTTTSTASSTKWTWRSNARTGGTLPPLRQCADGTRNCAFEPLLFARYDLGVGLTNAVPPGRPATIAVTVRHQELDPAPAANQLSLDISGDDGATWSAATVRPDGDGRFTATVVPAAGFLSLRIRASDPQGAVLDQTIIRAVRVAS
jgi:hypothetical protein